MVTFPSRVPAQNRSCRSRRHRQFQLGHVFPRSAISNIKLNGVVMDTAELRIRSFSLQRGSLGFDCTLPCSFGYQPGTYTFDAYARGFYRSSAQAAASYADPPAGCPATHGTPTSTSVALTEFDSARVSFQFTTAANATGIASSEIAQITFDDGSGPQTIDLRFPWPTFQTRNTGNLRVRFVVGLPDTLAVGEMDLPLKKDWQWSIDGHLSTGLPGNFCSGVKAFPLRRLTPGADSLRLTSVRSAPYPGWLSVDLTPGAWCTVRDAGAALYIGCRTFPAILPQTTRGEPWTCDANSTVAGPRSWVF